MEDNNWGKILKHIRINYLHLTQDKFAALFDPPISKSTVSRLELSSAFPINCKYKKDIVRIIRNNAIYDEEECIQRLYKTTTEKIMPKDKYTSRDNISPMQWAQQQPRWNDAVGKALNAIYNLLCEHRGTEISAATFKAHCEHLAMLSIVHNVAIDYYSASMILGYDNNGNNKITFAVLPF